MGRFIFLFTIILSLGISIVHAQDYEIRLGKNKIATYEPFTITLVSQGKNIKSYSGFPNIAGFRKGGISQSSNTQIINGKYTSSIEYIQSYQPTKKGTFELKPFSITVNGTKVSSYGTKIIVNDTETDNKYVALSLNKSTVYIGEGIRAEVAFYVPRSEANLIQYNNALAEELIEIKTALKQNNIWLEDESPKELKFEDTKINGVNYKKVTLVKAILFPQKSGDFRIPSLSATFSIYKNARGGGFFQRRRLVSKVYSSTSKKLKVKPLPPHPLRDQLPVGQFSLKSTLSDTAILMGSSFVYEFKIVGNGNIKSLPEPTLPARDGLNFLSPQIKVKTNSKNRLKGSKTFTYDVTSEQAGYYSLKNYLQWIYFDPIKKRYDTLHPIEVVHVNNQLGAESNLNTNFGTASTSTPSTILVVGASGFAGINYLKLYINILIVCLLLALGFIIWKSKKQHG